MKRVLSTLALALILGGTMMAQQETAPDVYGDKAPEQQQQQTAHKKQPAHKQTVAKKQAKKTTLVAAKTTVKPVAIAARNN